MMEGETEERETLQLLVYLASLKPGAWNALHISHGVAGPEHVGHPCCFPRLTGREREWKWSSRT